MIVSFYPKTMSENAKTKREIIFVTFEEILFLLSYPLVSKGLSMRKPKHNRRLRRREPSSLYILFEFWKSVTLAKQHQSF